MGNKTKWLLYAVGGLMVFGFGLSLLGEAIIAKYTNNDYWIAWGTSALVVTNSGLCLFGQAVVERVKLKRETI